MEKKAAPVLLAKETSTGVPPAERMGQLDQRLTEILQAESKLFALKERIDNTLA
jgi:hypothetical protein